MMELYDFEVLKGDETIAATRSVALPYQTAAWPRIADIAKNVAEPGCRNPRHQPGARNGDPHRRRFRPLHSDVDRLGRRKCGVGGHRSLDHGNEFSQRPRSEDPMMEVAMPQRKASFAQAHVPARAALHTIEQPGER